eukprot:TRINITY_DN5264_c0_g1_i6.p1 TRINITY_DN5264_c0_g1~~TRINITY_DN5264_c0_g1_i6.p1  ORF type:complete len:204 (+),score=27.87 TRINITY_DN5264_c0_g1_i6:81-692(+)
MGSGSSKSPTFVAADPDDFDSWKVLAADHCQQWQVPYALGRFQGALRDAEILASKRLPSRYWKELQELDSLSLPARYSVAVHEKPTTEDVRRLAHVLVRAVDLNEAAHGEIDLMRRKLDSLPPDVALKLDDAFDKVESHARSMFSSAYPCCPGAAGARKHRHHGDHAAHHHRRSLHDDSDRYRPPMVTDPNFLKVYKKWKAFL